MKIRDKAHTLALAYFCKRVGFNAAYGCSHGENEEEKKAMAYRILEALDDVRAELEDEGYVLR
jgi:hypothetical protein